MVEAVSLPNTYETMYRQATALVSQGQHDAAIGILQRIVRRISSLSRATLTQQENLARFGLAASQQLSALLSAGGRYEEAIAVIRGMAKLSPEEEDALERQAALVKTEEGRLDEARAELTALAERFPHDPAHWLALARVEISSGGHAEAEQALERAAEAAGGDADRASVQYMRFVLHAARSSVPEALAAWTELASLDADGALHLASRLYDLLLRTGELTVLRRYLDADSAPLRREYYRGLLANRAGDFTGGRHHWEGLLATNPLEQRLGQLQWAEAALRLGKTDEALALVATGTGETRSARGMLLLAIGLARKKQVIRAAEVLVNGTRILRSGTPRRERYSSEDWDLLTSLVDGRGDWEQLKTYFDAVAA